MLRPNELNRPDRPPIPARREGLARLGSPAHVYENELIGRAAQDFIYQVFTSKGHAARVQQSPFGGRAKIGELAVDLVTDKAQAAIEIKSIKLSSYFKNGQLDAVALERKIGSDVKQIRRHVVALREAKALGGSTMPIEERLLYVPWNCTEQEARQFQTMFRKALRDGHADIKGGVYKTHLVAPAKVAGNVSDNRKRTTTAEAEPTLRAGKVLRAAEAGLALWDLMTTEPPPAHPENVLMAPVFGPLEAVVNELKQVIETPPAPEKTYEELSDESRRNREGPGGGAEGAGPY